MKQIPVVDIFAGPGGLGEGFSGFVPESSSHRPFRIALSAEMDESAAKTLLLRAFFRQFEQGLTPESYYEYVTGNAKVPWRAETRAQWKKAEDEALQLTLGDPGHDAILRDRIRKIAGGHNPWVLVGGPPCQAYSLVGRSRNHGKPGYRAENDERHFLYTHYLRILTAFRPAAFVMENVKGILSSRIEGEFMFPRILEDLHQPGGKGGIRYKIIPLAVQSQEESGFGRNFTLRSEELGVPQARHRVVLLGLQEGIDQSSGMLLTPTTQLFSVAEAIGGLPKLRSGVTRRPVEHWPEFARNLLRDTARLVPDSEVARKLRAAAEEIRERDPGTGGAQVRKSRTSDRVSSHLTSWLTDPRLNSVLNHEARNHMHEDLMRYGFAAAFAQVHGRSPRGAREFPGALHPKHHNWRSGKFVDRFKVQISTAPGSTVMSHLSKDGHYFIHPDPVQLRSLTVREAARLQTFPDNYFFEGARGAQFRQVGNAVPPWLARQIAGVVYSFISN